MDQSTRRKRAQILRRQVVIEETHCAGCPDSPARKQGSKSCPDCVFGKALLAIGCELDQALGPRRGGHRISEAPVLTDDVIATAIENGISKKTLRIRVQQFFWPLEKAMTQPVMKNHMDKGVEV